MDISSADECAACGGQCCKRFTLYAKYKRGRRKAALAAAKREFEGIYAGWEVLSVKAVKPLRIVATVTCTSFANGKCTDYENRPTACKNFPYTALKDGMMEPTDACPLTKRIAKEMEANE